MYICTYMYINVVKVYCKGKSNLMSDIYKCNKRNKHRTNIVRPPPPLDKSTGRQYKPSYQVLPLEKTSATQHLRNALTRKSATRRSTTF
jgi:hypothetical protein